MNRRNIIILTIILLALLGGGIYWYLSKGATPATPGDLFPGGSTGSTGGTITEVTPGEGEGSPTITALPRLYELHKTPVAGIGLAEEKDKKGVVTSVSARYVERALGHIFETKLSTYNETRIVNETRSRIAEALWGNNGNSVVLRFVDEKNGNAIRSRIINIEIPGISFARSTSTESTTGYLKTEEVFLPDYISFLSTSEDGTNNIFYLESSLSAALGTTSTFKNTNSTKIFSSPFTEWLPQYPNQKLITLATKPSAEVFGYVFFLDPKTKTATKMLGDINGLTTLTSPDGKFILYSETKTDGPELSLFDVKTKKTYALYVKTLPEKCVWGKKSTTLIYCAVPQDIPKGTYPDQWYQGTISFSDDLWSIDTISMISTKILSPEKAGATALDIINPVISSNDEYLLFMNKKTNTPWVYSVVEPKPIVPPVVSGKSTSTTSISTSTSATTQATTTKPEITPSVVTPEMQKLK